MNKYFLKGIRDNIPESLKYLIAPIFRNKLIKHKEYCRFRKLLFERELLSEEAIKAYQFDELKKILIYADCNVLYYTELFDQIGFRPKEMKFIEEINVIPYLTKEIIRENYEKLISTKKISKGYYSATTGGSTGKPLKVLLDYECVFKENAFNHHFYGKLGYKTEDRLATFRGVEFGDKLWKYNPMQNELLFSPFKLSNITLKDYVDMINKFKPDYLNGYLSSLYYFAKLLSENNLKLNYPIKGIFLCSENIDKKMREFLEQFFQVSSLTSYGHSERCIIAEEISPNEYVFDPYYGYTEFIKIEDTISTIVGTGFLNKTMPLIRYITDDNCYFLSQGYAIESNRKSTDGLYGYNGEFFGHATLNFHNDIYKNLLRYQYVQTQKGKVDLLLIVNKNFKVQEIEFIKKEIDKKTKGVIDFNIKITDQLILSMRGKYKMYISEMK
jgi:phenylacetate-CoA ligase